VWLAWLVLIGRADAIGWTKPPRAVYDDEK
jgi:hypothetical protein